MRLAILTPSFPGTTVAASELNFWVRDVTRCFLTANGAPNMNSINYNSYWFSTSTIAETAVQLLLSCNVLFTDTKQN